MCFGQKPRTQPDPRRNERSGPPPQEPQRKQQQDPQDNKQGHRHGGGGSSVKPPRERDGVSPHVPTPSTEEYNSGNTAVTDSNNTANHSRAYDHTQHTEITHSQFDGGVSFNTHHYGTPQSGPPMDLQMHGDLQKLVQAISWHTLSRQLSIVDQDKRHCRISPFNRDKPENFWISKNIDFKQWESAHDSRALLLSAPAGHGTTEICSHVIGLAKVSQTNSFVLYFFSTAAEARRLTVFTHTLLHQVVCCSNVEKADSIAATFLDTLLGEHFQRPTQAFKKNDEQATTIQKILSAPDNVLIEALAEAIKRAEIPELSIIIDGLSEDVVRLVVKHSMRAIRKLKALFTIDESPKYAEKLDRMTCIEYDKERKECLRSLQYDDTRYNKISDEHHGSLEWLWNNSEYRQWSASTTSSLLYVEGKPGSGKSTLAKYFKENIEREPNTSSSIVAHYFYTFRGTKLESTHENMLRSILHSILDQDESTFYLFQLEFRKFRRANCSEWPYPSLKRILSSFAEYPSTKPLYLILDAVDESKEEDRRRIIEIIYQLCSTRNRCNIKAFLASRPVAELTQRNVHHIKMQDENKGDISRYAKDFLHTDLQMSEKIHEATDYITENAQGVFVWVSLVKAELLSCIERGRPDAEILQCLNALPRDLKDMYTFMFHKLEDNNPEVIQDGIKLFRLLLFALRPLTVVELRDALIPDDDNPAHESRQQIHAFKKRMTHSGGNFLEIKADETVQLMHQTAREFLILTVPAASQLNFHISDLEAHRVITTTLIRYLSLYCISPSMEDIFSKITSWSPENVRAYAEYLNGWPLIEYTFRYMKDHHDLGCPNEEVSQLVTKLVGQLADNQASYFFGSFLNFRLGNNCGTAFPLNEYQETSENMKYITLNAAADPKLPKLPYVVEALLITCTQDAPHAQRKTPLIISVQKGLAGATQRLLDLHDDKDTKDDSGRTALHYAAENGDEAIVQLLMEHGADSRIRDNSNETALQIAVKKL